MARRLLALGVVGLLLTGCVSRDQYEAVKLERNSLAEQLATAQAGSSADRAAAEAWKSQQDRLITAGDDKDKAGAGEQGDCRVGGSDSRASGQVHKRSE